MSRVRNFDGFEVRVFPDTSNLGGRIDLEGQLCDMIAKQIEELLPSVKHAATISRTKWACSHCGADWTESETASWNAGCCDGDCAEEPR